MIKLKDILNEGMSKNDIMGIVNKVYPEIVKNLGGRAVKVEIHNNIYRRLVDADNLYDVKNLYFNKKTIDNLADSVFNGIQRGEQFQGIVDDDELLGASLAALNDLTDRYLGRSIMQSSARVMDTLGRESATLAESIQKGAPNVNDDRAMELIIDKMQYILDEYALNKYLSGWRLRNKNWFDQVPPK